MAKPRLSLLTVPPSKHRGYLLLIRRIRSSRLNKTKSPWRQAGSVQNTQYYSNIFKVLSKYSNKFDCVLCHENEYKYLFEHQNILIFEYSNIRAHPWTPSNYDFDPTFLWINYINRQYAFTKYVLYLINLPTHKSYWAGVGSL